MAAGKPMSSTQTLKSELRAIQLQLERVQSAVVVAVAALRQQACERDLDIAAVLESNVADRIHDQIEKLEAALKRLSQSERKP
jgi:hypothetical protein